MGDSKLPHARGPAIPEEPPVPKEGSRYHLKKHSGDVPETMYASFMATRMTHIGIANPCCNSPRTCPVADHFLIAPRLHGLDCYMLTAT